MKFKYFFIIILIIELFLQVNRIVNKGSYFSISQEVSFEKKAPKNSKYPFKRTQKMLVYYNKKSEQSMNILYNLEHMFKYNKINYTVADIGEIIPTSDYDTFIFATETFIGFQKSMFETIRKETFEGKKLIFLNNTPYNPFNEIAGIKKVDSLVENSSEIFFSEKLFPGLDKYSPTKEIVVHPTMKVQIDSNVRILARSKENIPLLWEKTYGKGLILYTNASFFADRITRGLMNQWIGYGNDWYITPILNAKLMHIDDFPAPVPRTLNSNIHNHYHISTRDFYKQIWWKDMLEIAKRRNIIFSGFIIIDYNHTVRKENMKRISDLTLKDLSLEGRELFLHHGELGVHGYNHNPLVYNRKEVNFKALNYVPWENQEDMAASINQIKSYVKELFGSKVKLYTYVPPSNIIRNEGLEAIVKNFPDMNTVSAIFYGNSDEGAYVQEVERNRDFPSLYNLPRFSSGFYYDNNEMWSLYNAIATYGYWSHFVHPDDLISKDRSRNKSWAELKGEFEKILIDVEANMPFLTSMRAVDMTKKYANIEDIKIFSEKLGNEIHVGVENFRDPFDTLIRVRNKKINKISSGTFREVYNTGNTRIYLVSINNEDTTIYLGD